MRQLSQNHYKFPDSATRALTTLTWR